MVVVWVHSEMASSDVSEPDNENSVGLLASPKKSRLMAVLSLSEENPRPLKRFKLRDTDGGLDVVHSIPETLARDFREVPVGLLTAVFESSHFNVSQTRQVLRQLVDEERDVMSNNKSRKRTHTGRLIPDEAYARGPAETVSTIMHDASPESCHAALASSIMQALMNSGSSDAAQSTLVQYLKSFEQRVTEGVKPKNEGVLSRAVRLLAREVNRLKQAADQSDRQVQAKNAILADAERGLQRLQDVNSRLAARLSQMDIDDPYVFRFDDPPPPVC